MREVVSDCALPIAVLVCSFIGSYLFLDIERKNIFVKALDMTLMVRNNHD